MLYTDDFSKIENFQKAKADNFQNWVIHHRLETHDSDGNIRAVFLTKAELIALDIYYNRPPEKLIYMTRAEHCRLHNISKGKSHPHSAEWNAENSIRMKNQWKSGVRQVSTAFLEAAKSNAKGRKWYTNGKVDIMAFECPDGFIRGRSQMKNLIKNRKRG